MRVIPQQHLGVALVVERRRRILVRVLQFAIAQLVKELVGKISRLLDPLRVHQAEPAVEGFKARTGLLEDVGEHPVRHRLHGASALLELSQDVGRLVVAVVGRIGRRVRRAPFGVVQLELRHGRRVDLLAVLEHVVGHGHGVGAQDRAGGAEFIEEALVHAVRVGGDEVQRDAVLAGVADHLGDPVAARTGRAAHAVRRIDALDGARGVRVQLEIFFLRAGPEAVQVRFIPDFEVPACHFGLAIALGPVHGQCLDQAFPLRVIARRRDITAPPEDGLGAAGHRGWHEAQFDKWLDADALQVVEQGVDVLEVVLLLALRIDAEDGHVVA